MDYIETKYGDVYGVSHINEYEDGVVKECILNQENIIKTPYGNLVPRYEQENVRDKYNKSISFYKNGNIKSMALQKASLIKTAYGDFEAELLTFYNDGSIKRLFPLNGKLTGYWEEEQEKTLAKPLVFNQGMLEVNHKCISLTFYNSGVLKAITLWDNEYFTLETKHGMIISRIGAKFYESSKLLGIEPAYPSLITTPIGEVFCFDAMAVGIHSDNPSLKFTEDDQVMELKTSTDYIEITGKSGIHIIYKPKLIPNMMNPDEMETLPLTISIGEESIKFNNSLDHEYLLNEVEIKIKHKVHAINGGCSSCSSCSGNC